MKSEIFKLSSADYLKTQIETRLVARQRDKEESLSELSSRQKILESGAAMLKSGSVPVISDKEQINVIVNEIDKFLASEQLGTVRSGSDGKFAIPPKARYISALVKRDYPEEELFWLLKIDLKDTQVHLSNSNIVTVQVV